MTGILFGFIFIFASLFGAIFGTMMSEIFGAWFKTLTDRHRRKNPTIAMELEAVHKELAETKALQERTLMMFALHGVDDEANKTACEQIALLDNCFTRLVHVTKRHDQQIDVLNDSVVEICDILKGQPND